MNEKERQRKTSQLSKLSILGNLAVLVLRVLGIPSTMNFSQDFGVKMLCKESHRVKKFDHGIWVLLNSCWIGMMNCCVIICLPNWVTPGVVRHVLAAVHDLF